MLCQSPCESCTFLNTSGGEWMGARVEVRSGLGGEEEEETAVRMKDEQTNNK